MRGTVLVTLGVLTTTADEIQNRPVREYLGIVSGEAIIVIHRAGRRGRIRDLRLNEGRRRAVNALAKRASARGGTVVVGVEFDYVQIGDGRLLVSATGTAVRL